MNLAKIVKTVIGFVFLLQFCVFAFVFLIIVLTPGISGSNRSNLQGISARIFRLPGQKYCTNLSPNSYTENITNAKINGVVNDDGSINMSEEISMIFPEPSHGIERYIPLLVEAQFDDGKYYVTKGSVSDISVSRSGIPETFAVLNETAPDTVCNISGVDTNQEYLYLKIGSEYRTLAVGNYTYTINYKIHNGLVKNPDGFPFFYINLWGTKWNANVQKFSAQVTFPSNVNISKTFCYQGQYGESKRSCNLSNSGNIYNYSTTNLKPFEAITVTAEFQNYSSTNIVSNIGNEIKMNDNEVAMANISRIVQDWIVILITLFLPTGTAFLIYKKSHTIPENKVIYPIYTPPDNMSPAQIGMLVDGFVQDADLASIIISLCVKGWMKLKEEDNFLGLSKTYTFINNPEILRKATDLSFEEQKVYDKIFENGKSEIKQNELGISFATAYQGLKGNLYAWGIQNKYLTQDPELLFQKFGLGIVIALILFINFLTSTIISLILIPISIIVSILIFRRISVFTKLGRDLQQKALGFKMYLGTAEKNKIEYLDDPNKHDTETFEKYLPYAMSLGVTKIWTDKFQDIFTVQPDWYVGGDYTTFNNGVYLFNSSNFANSFSNSMNSLSSSINTTYSSSSGRGLGGGNFGGGSWGGGGFSGGGGFGGGGGRW